MRARFPPPRPPPLIPVPVPKPHRSRLREYLKLTWHEVRHTCHALGRLLLDFILGFTTHPEMLLALFLLFVTGVGLEMVGNFLIRFASVFKVILDILGVGLNLLRDVFDALIPVLNGIFEVIAGMINAISSIGDFFSGGHHHDISPIDLQPIPSLDWVQKLGQWYSLLGDLSITCAPFTQVAYECLFPLRYLCNEAVCPVVRFTYGTLLHGLLAFFLGAFYFDDNPNGNNCANPPQLLICFGCHIGLLVSFGLTTLLLVIWRWLDILRLVYRLTELVVTLLGLGLYMFMSIGLWILGKPPTTPLWNVAHHYSKVHAAIHPAAVRTPT
jgi:hypothetical protein